MMLRHVFEIGGGPSPLARYYGVIPPAEVRSWDNGHRYSAAATAYSFKHFIEPEVAQEYPDWNPSQVRTEAVRRLKVRLEENKISQDQELRRQDNFTVTWKIEEIEGRDQMVTYYGDGQRQTLEGLWENTKKFAQEKGKLAYFNEHEQRIQLEMQDALISGKANATATIISHPDGMRYVSVWEKGEDGGVKATQTDFTFELGHDFSTAETVTLMHHLQQKYRDTTIASDQSYPHILLKEGSVVLQDIKVIAAAVRIAGDSAVRTPVPPISQPGVAYQQREIAPVHSQPNTIHRNESIEEGSGRDKHLVTVDSVLSKSMLRNDVQIIEKDVRNNDRKSVTKDYTSFPNHEYPFLDALSMQETSVLVLQAPMSEVVHAGVYLLPFLAEKEVLFHKQVLSPEEQVRIDQEVNDVHAFVITPQKVESVRRGTDIEKRENISSFPDTQQRNESIIAVLSDTLVIVDTNKEKSTEMSDAHIVTLDIQQAVSDLLATDIEQLFDEIIPSNASPHQMIPLSLAAFIAPGDITDKTEHTGKTIEISLPVLHQLREEGLKRTGALQALLIASRYPALSPLGVFGLFVLAEDFPVQINDFEMKVGALFANDETTIQKEQEELKSEKSHTLIFADMRAGLALLALIQVMSETGNDRGYSVHYKTPDMTSQSKTSDISDEEKYNMVPDTHLDTQYLPTLVLVFQGWLSQSEGLVKQSVEKNQSIWGVQSERRDSIQFAKRPVHKETYIPDTSKKRREHRQIVRSLSVLLLVWYVMHNSETKQHLAVDSLKSQKKSTEGAGYRNGLKNEETAVSTTPWVLFAIIWHMSLMRESGMSLPTKKTKKQKKKKHVLPLSGVIFRYV